MKGLLQRNPLFFATIVATLLALAAAGYALAVDHGSEAAAPQARPTMMMPF